MAHLTWELLPVSEEGRPSCVYCSLPGEHLCFLTDKIMLFYMKGGGFYLTLFWGFVHVWNANICTFYMATFLLSREREDAVTDFCNIDCVLYCCDVCVVRHDDGLQKRPCWSSKHSYVREARLSQNSLMLHIVTDVESWRKVSDVFYIQHSPVKMFYLKFNRKSWHTAVRY